MRPPHRFISYLFISYLILPVPPFCILSWSIIKEQTVSNRRSGGAKHGKKDMR